MATVRFLKLPEEKKKRILQAGFQEFARYPYRDASINRIIKNAEISRRALEEIGRHTEGELFRCVSL